jgi:hypothetical protein
MENTMDKKNNPFKVPENYFDNLNKRLEKEAKTKHVSVSRVLKYVASISLILTLSISIFIIGFNYDRKEPLLSFNVLNLFISQNKETLQQNQQQNQYSEEIAWENQVKEMVKELDKKPISIKVLNIRVDTARDLALKLYNTSSEIVKTAAACEMAIVYGNRYRPVYKNLDSELTSAENLFYKGDYKKSLEKSMRALNGIEPGIADKLMNVVKN